MTTAAALSTVQNPSKGLHIALWVVQALLGLAFLAAGFMKASAPIEELVKNMPWAGRFSPGMVRFIGISELLGGLGLILPAATRLKPILTPIAASGLVVIMILAGAHHVMNAEQGLVANLVLGALAAFIAWGRFRKAPIAPRG